MFSMLAIAGASILTNTESSYIRIATNNSSVDTGEYFSIDVYVSAHVPVNAVDLKLSFPENQIKITGIDVGQSVITFWTKDPYVENNIAYFQGGTFRNGFTGEHLVATVNALAKEGGSAKFSVNDVRLLAGDGQGSTITIEESGYESLTVYVGEDIEGEHRDSKIQGSVAVAIYTDINGDGSVSISDIRSFMSAWGSGSKKYDFNGDGKMTFRDFAIILADSFLK